MKHIRLLLAAITLSFLLVTASVSPVLAQEETTVSNTQTTDQKAEAAKKAAQAKNQRQKQESETEIATDGAVLLKKFSAAKKKEQTQEQRAKACQVRKQGIEKKFSNYVTNSKKHKAKFDDALEKAVSYQTEKTVTSDELTTLLTAAQTAGTQATASIDAMAELSPSVDCNKDSVAADVASFKAAVDKTKTDLKAYRTAIKAYIKAVKNASPLPATAETGQ